MSCESCQLQIHDRILREIIAVMSNSPMSLEVERAQKRSIAQIQKIERDCIHEREGENAASEG